MEHYWRKNKDWDFEMIESKIFYQLLLISNNPCMQFHTQTISLFFLVKLIGILSFVQTML